MDVLQVAEKLFSRSDELAASLHKQGKFWEAEEQYNTVIPQLAEICTQSAEGKKFLAAAYNNRGYIRYKQVEFDKALEDYNNAIIYFPALASAYYNRGTIHYRLCGGYELHGKIESLERGMSDFKKAVELEPGNEEFGIGYASCEKLLKSTKCEELLESAKVQSMA